MNQDTGAARRILLDPEFMRLKNYIIATTGLSYFENKEDDLAGRIARRFSVIGEMDCTNYRILLGTSTATGSEFDYLVSELTIGETFFFRHSEQFDAFRSVVVPKLIEKNAAKRSIRIWCAGCSTGAEPYTLSIILRHEFRVMLAGWTIEIIGTDINRTFLQRATSGDFDDWHLRTVSEPIRSLCFRRKEKDRGWLIQDEYKKGMNFLHHNLISGRYPPLGEANEVFDVIFCRNVMIYFNTETVGSILPRFDQCLSEAGFLFLGYSEINTDLYKAFDIVSFPGALLFQKKSARAKASEPGKTLLKAVDWPAIAAPSQAPAHLKNPVPVPIPSDTLSLCRDATNQGQYRKALALAEDAIIHDSLDSRAHYLKGVCLWQLSEWISAEEALRRAIYIDRKFVLAHYHLALVHQKLGDKAKVERYLTNVMDLLKILPENSGLTEGDEMSVFQLNQIIKTMKDAS